MQDIATPFYAHRLMSAEWQLVADLMGGTRTMRVRPGLRWLPREAAESWSAWRSRLNRTFYLMPLHGRCIPFIRSAILSASQNR